MDSIQFPKGYYVYGCSLLSTISQLWFDNDSIMKSTLVATSLAIGFVLISLNCTGQLTPEQRYFEWASLPFPKEEFQRRRESAIAKLANTNEIVLIPSRDGLSQGETFRQTDDFIYFTGLELPGSMLVINSEEKEIILFTPKRDFRFENPSRRNDFPGRPLATDPELKTLSGIENIQPFETLHNYLKNKMPFHVFSINDGVKGQLTSLKTGFITSWSTEQTLRFHLEQNYPGIRIQNAYETIASLRMIKSPLEIEALKKAVDITIKGIVLAARSIRPGVDERTLEAVMEAEFKRQGSPRVPFASIIKSGPNSLWPWRILAAHYQRRNRKMNAGELVIFDVGCEYNYYVSDMGRTFPVSGRFTDEQRQILKMGISVSDAIIAAVKPGITFADLKRVADDTIPDNEKKYMQVGLHFGHHIGLSSGDPNDADAVLQPGMVFTVEPWYYNHDKEISVFTEDEVLVTEAGYELLTKSLPRTPEALEKMVAKK